MNISSALNDLKKILVPVTLTGFVAVLSILLGKLIIHWFFDEAHWSTGGLALVFGLACALVVGVSYVAHEVYAESEGHEPGHKAARSSLKLKILLLTLCIIIGIETLAAVMESFLHAQVHDSASAAWVIGLFVVLIYVLSWGVYRLRRNFQNISFEGGQVKPPSSAGIGLIIPLSNPHSQKKGAALPLMRKVHNGADQLDVEDLLARFESKRLPEIVNALQAIKHAGHDAGHADTDLHPNPLGDRLATLPYFNWAMMLVALNWLQQQNVPVRHVHFLGSDDGKGSAHNSAPYMADAQRIAAHFGLDATSSRVDFDDINQVYNSIKGILQSAPWRGMPTVIDVTGGKKPISVAGSAVAAHIENCQIVYVDTNDLEPKVWNPRAHDTAPSIGA